MRRQSFAGISRFEVEGTWANVEGAGSITVEPRKLTVKLPAGRTWPYQRGNIVSFEFGQQDAAWQFKGQVLFKRLNHLVVLER